MKIYGPPLLCTTILYLIGGVDAMLLSLLLWIGWFEVLAIVGMLDKIVNPNGNSSSVHDRGGEDSRKW